VIPVPQGELERKGVPIPLRTPPVSPRRVGPGPLARLAAAGPAYARPDPAALLWPAVEEPCLYPRCWNIRGPRTGLCAEHEAARRRDDRRAIQAAQFWAQIRSAMEIHPERRRRTEDEPQALHLCPTPGCGRMIAGKFCKACYQRLWSKLRRRAAGAKPRAYIRQLGKTCARHPDRKVWAKGLCRNCYCNGFRKVKRAGGMVAGAGRLTAGRTADPAPAAEPSRLAAC
jgi:hypothetical protein